MRGLPWRLAGGGQKAPLEGGRQQPCRSGRRDRDRAAWPASEGGGQAQIKGSSLGGRQTCSQEGQWWQRTTDLPEGGPTSPQAKQSPLPLAAATTRSLGSDAGKAGRPGRLTQPGSTLLSVWGGLGVFLNFRKRQVLPCPYPPAPGPIPSWPTLCKPSSPASQPTTPVGCSVSGPPCPAPPKSGVPPEL